MIEMEIITKVREFDSIGDLNNVERKLVEQARQSVFNAYSPYSGFKVGTAILLTNGEIITGSNQENAAFPSGMCSERIALFYANSKYPEIQVTAIAVAAYRNGDYSEEPVSPCGSCRQVMLETEERQVSSIKLILSGRKKIKIIEGVSQLLPLHFDNHQINS